MRNHRIQTSIMVLVVVAITGCQSGVGWPRWDWWRSAKTNQEETSSMARSASPQLPPLPSWGASPASKPGSALATSGTNSNFSAPGTANSPTGGNTLAASYPGTATPGASYPSATYPTTQANSLSGGSSTTSPAAGYMPSYPAGVTAPQTGPYNPNAYASSAGSPAAGSGTRGAMSPGRTAAGSGTRGAMPLGSTGATTASTYPATPRYGAPPTQTASGMGSYSGTSYPASSMSTGTSGSGTRTASTAITNPLGGSSSRTADTRNSVYPGSYGSPPPSSGGAGNRYSRSTATTSSGSGYGAATSPAVSGNYGTPSATATAGPYRSGSSMNTGNAISPPATTASAYNASPPPADYRSPVANRGMATAGGMAPSSYAKPAPGTNTTIWPKVPSKYRPGGTSDYTPPTSSPTAPSSPQRTRLGSPQSFAPPQGTTPKSYPSPYSPYGGGASPAGTRPMQGTSFGTSGGTSQL